MWPARPARCPRSGEGLKRGVPNLEAALPPARQLTGWSAGGRQGTDTTRVVIGMDPHKRWVTIEVMCADESVVSTAASTPTGPAPAPCSSRCGRGRAGVGGRGLQRHRRHVALRLLADGEQVIDVPPKLSAPVGQFATGQGRKTDATDAHSWWASTREADASGQVGVQAPRGRVDDSGRSPSGRLRCRPPPRRPTRSWQQVPGPPCCDRACACLPSAHIRVLHTCQAETGARAVNVIDSAASGHRWTELDKQATTVSRRTTRIEPDADVAPDRQLSWRQW